MNRKIIHAADIHLDSPLQKLSQYEGAPAEQIRRASRGAFTNLIDFAIREAVDLVVIAGDLYDGDWPDQNTGLFFVKEARIVFGSMFIGSITELSPQSLNTLMLAK